ncbi:DNA polymerase III beta subunit (EC 2.7.7.7) [Oscillospiraceae bacterium]|jgi:DNA polymerase-3 subunit beta|nr:DNA polymerase III subunit beta [Bacillota bacterium]CAH0542996.1 DNA polymerase III beta subunit (EC 2.7.7.7) [Oscillospiraceae bacterium]
MKFTCEKNQLVSAISVASRTVAQKSAISGLEGILIRAGVKVMLTGYNLETGITVSVDADIQETGACVMPARLFFDIVRKLPDDTVSIQVDESFKVSIKGGISSFTITALSADDYPELPDVDSEKGIRVPQNELKAMISGTIFAVSENQARPIHTGVLFEVDNDSITSVAVDGYRLALRRYLPEESLERTLKFVAPAAALKEVEKILGDTDDPATFYPGSKHILFTIGDATLVCRILEGEFLDWRRVLPQNNPVKLVGNVSRLTDSIERVGLVISEKLKSPVRCKFGDNAAELRTVSTIGEAYDVCPIAGDGKDLEIGFNCKYLLDALRAVPDSECTLEMINGLSPIVLNPTEGNRYSYMVLPVRLKAGE